MAEIDAQGTIIKIASGTGGAKNIAGITLGAITKVESTAHGFAVGDVVTFASIVGTTDLNTVTAAIIATETNFVYFDINSSGYGEWVSGGTMTPQTYTVVGEVTGWSISEGSRSERNVTDLADTERKFSPGIFERGQVSLDVKWSHTDTGFGLVLTSLDAKTQKIYQVTFSDAEVESFYGFVLSAEKTGAEDDILRGTMTLRIQNEAT